jgi:threonyl-tRNA synthetase
LNAESNAGASAEASAEGGAESTAAAAGPEASFLDHGHDDDPLYRRRHSLAHVLAQAVLEVRPGTRLGFGPPVDNGFYYDFDLSEPLTPEDLPAIEKRMRKIIGRRQEFELRSMPAEAAIAHLEERGEAMKAEYARELRDRGIAELTFYRNGPFEDMCEGPHVTSTADLDAKAFKLDSIAGAYWRGDEKRPMLTRIYGLAFGSREELDAYIEKRRLAAERDHRKLGKELDLFVISEEIGPGLPLWLPNGTVIRDELEAFAREMEFKQGYQPVATPHIAREELYYTSGHLPYYKDSMFPPMEMPGESNYYMKAMNCPHHHIIFRSVPRSYRDLPLRLSEYGDVYRYELSGTLAGLLRVRGMSMNDAHIYCTEGQVRDEFAQVLELCRFYYDYLRLSHYWMRLSTHDPDDPKKGEKYLDDPEGWAFAERVVREILDESGLPYEVGKGEAAFYGPKVDYQIENVVGREETASTNQLDFGVAERFDLRYKGRDGEYHRPFIIHRAPLSTHERMISFLIEHYNGAFPTWLAPVQVRVVPVADDHAVYAEKVVQALRARFIRAELDASGDSFNKRLRNGITRKIPNLLVIGGQEVADQTVTWRRYVVREQQTLALDAFVDLIDRARRERLMDNYEDVAIG